MDTKTQTNRRREAPAGGRAVHDGEHHAGRAREDGPGVDLPVVGHVDYKSVGFLAGLGVAGALGAIEWPVAAAVGIGYALAKRR